MSAKIAQTKHQVIDLIKHRWSPRSFTEKAISEKDTQTILEAGSWAPSAGNSQPWRYVYAHKGTEGFEKLLATLAPGNQPWAKHAAVLIAAIGIKELPDTQQKFFYFMHDVGMSNSYMLLQAFTMDIYGHVMAGFSKPQMAELLALPANEEPVCVLALGYLDEADKLEEPYKSRELAARTRKSLDEFTTLLD
jgi:nitroreductase